MHSYIKDHSNRSNLQVWPRCYAVSKAAVISTSTAPTFFSAEKLSSIFCDSKVI